MKTIRFAPQLIAAIIAGCLSSQSAHAVLDTWNATTDGNWSLDGNWDQGFAPGSADDARFFNTGADTVNTVDVSSTINSLTYNQDNGASHTTVISPGQTLTINSGVAAGTALLLVGSAGGAATASTVTTATITGEGGGLVLNGAGDVVVHQGFSSANGTHNAILDLSGLDSFTANVGRLLIGQAPSGNNPFNRPAGTLILAKTNSITLTGASPQVILQDSAQNGNGTVPSVLTFGQENYLNGDVMRLGGQKADANLNFNPAFSQPSLTVRNADGVSPVSIIDFGYHAAAASGNTVTVTADFSSGTVDLLANLVNIAQGNPNGGLITSTLTLGAGTFNVNDLEIGWGVAAAGSAGPVTATVNVNNSFLFSTGAVVTANTLLRLARTNGGSGVVSGTLNLNGGTVIANTIVSGGGVSAINVNADSTLVVSNRAGTLAAPIGTFTINDATLTIPASSAGAALFAKNFSAGGSQNTINISSIPPIGAYPATLPLIVYQSGNGGNFVLGPLPAGSPSYAGTLIDNGDGVISLSLTAGPLADVTETWTGASGGSWDTASYSWLYHSDPTNFFNGAVAVFDDTAAVSDIYLAESLSPGSITVNNSTLDYSFTGPGNIAGASALIKNGSGSLTLANSDFDNFVTVQINGGTLQLGLGDVDGSLSSINITNNGVLAVNRSGSLTLDSAISGTGTLTKDGDGILVLSGANSYSGATVLNAGALQVDQTSSGAGPLTTSAGTVLSGGGTVDGAVTVGGEIDPGSAGAPGVFKAHGGLTLSAGSTVNFDLSASDYFNPDANDAIEVYGDLVANNNAISVNISGAPQNGASYLLFTYTGTLSGSFNPVVTGTHFPVTLDTTSTPGVVYLNVTGDSGYGLTWNSFSDSTWDGVTSNWLNQADSTSAGFSAGDSVLFDDTPGVQTVVTIGAGVAVFPSAITNASDNNYFTINGAGKISGSTGIVKTNSSTLVIATANDFTGPVDVQAGTLQTGSGAALGSATAGTTVEPGATLDLNGQNLGGEVITISGSGVNGAGALVNNGAGQAQALRQIVLAGDATIGGTGLLGMNNSGGATSLGTGGNPYNLTKVGANQFTLQNIATVDTALANIDIQQGILDFSGSTSGMGDPAYTNIVEAGATLQLENNIVTWNKQFVFNGDGTTATVTIGSGGNETLAGPVELHGDCVFNVGGTMLTISGPISGDGGVIKTGGSPMIFTSPSTYTGDTRLNSAALRLNADADISSSPNIIISPGSTLTVTGLVNSTFILAGGQTLKGGGVVNGSLTTSAGSTLAPGMDGVGMFTVSNAVTLNGDLTMELDEANATNDVLFTRSGITYGGTLNLVNLGGPLSAGSSFKLFNAASYTGSFTINPPTPGPGQTWDTSDLLTSGTIKVVGGGATSPQFGGTVVSGGDVIFSGSGGVAGGTYYVLATTNVALPRSDWTPIATNVFDANGNFTFTNSLDSSVPQQFFQIQLP